MAKSWMIDELAHAGPEHLDRAFVAAYDLKAQVDPTEDVIVLQQLGLAQRSTVIDLGAGTGVFALAAAEQFGRIVAVDVSPAMVDLLRRRVTERSLSNVDLVEAGFLGYDHAGPPVDAVYTRNALHQLPDFWKGIALDRIAGMLRPRGFLRVRDLIYDVAPSDADARIEAWLDGAADDPRRGYTREDLAEHVRTEHSTYRWLFEPMLDAAGFDILDVEYRRSVYGAYTCVKR
jgi:ubiquinone/menaquinone biosynthesis C-methylase UbiE